MRAAFQPFGSLVEVRIKRSKENKKNLSYGFVEFASPIDAIKAMQDMDGQLLCGRALKVRWASKKQGGMKLPSTEKLPKDSPGTASIYVSFTCFNVMGHITEETLRADFQKYGEVSDVTIKYSTHDEHTGMQKGYGFVSYKEDYEGYAAVLAALGELANATVGNVSYKCELSRASKNLLEQNDFFSISAGSISNTMNDNGTKTSPVASSTGVLTSSTAITTGASLVPSNNSESSTMHSASLPFTPAPITIPANTAPTMNQKLASLNDSANNNMTLLNSLSASPRETWTGYTQSLSRTPPLFDEGYPMLRPAAIAALSGPTASASISSNMTNANINSNINTSRSGLQTMPPRHPFPAKTTPTHASIVSSASSMPYHPQEYSHQQYQPSLHSRPSTYSAARNHSNYSSNSHNQNYGGNFPNDFPPSHQQYNHLNSNHNTEFFHQRTSAVAYNRQTQDGNFNLPPAVNSASYLPQQYQSNNNHMLLDRDIPYSNVNHRSSTGSQMLPPAYTSSLLSQQMKANNNVSPRIFSTTSPSSYTTLSSGSSSSGVIERPSSSPRLSSSSFENNTSSAPLTSKLMMMNLTNTNNANLHTHSSPFLDFDPLNALDDFR